MWLCGNAQFVKLHNIERSNGSYVYDPISAPFANFFTLTDSNGVLRFAHIDTVIISDAYIENDSLCLIQFGDTTCIDNAISGGATDKNFAEDDLTFTGNREHDLNNNNLKLTNGGLMILEGVPLYITLSPFASSDKFVIENAQLKFDRFSGTDWVLANLGTTDLAIRPVSGTGNGSIVFETSTGTDLVTFRSGLVNNKITYHSYDSTPLGLTTTDFIGVLVHEGDGDMMSADSQALADFVGLDNAGVSGRIDNYVQTGDPGGGLDQQVGLQYNDVTYIMRLDSALLINGLHDGTATTVEVLKEGILHFDKTGLDAWEFITVEAPDGDALFPIGMGAEYSANLDSDTNNVVFKIGISPDIGNSPLGPAGGNYLSFESFYAPSAGNRFREFHLVNRDLAGNRRRVFTGFMDAINPLNTQFAFAVQSLRLRDPRALGADSTYMIFQRDNDDVSRMIMLASGGSVGGNTDGVSISVNRSLNEFIMEPFGVWPHNSRFITYGFDNFHVDKLRIQSDWGTTDGSDGNPAYLYGGESFYGGVVRVTYQELIDSLANYSDDDNMFSDSTLICIITQAMDTICADTSFFDESGEFCVVLLGDTTCIQIEGDGITYYNGNSSLSSDRTVQMADHYSWWRNGSLSYFKIDPTAGEPSIQTWNKNSSDPSFVINALVGTNPGWIHFNGNTAVGFQRDYGIGVDHATSALQFSETNLFNDFWMTYIGDRDSLIIRKGIKLDGKVWDEDGDQGSTGNIMLAQADGTVNWVDTTGLFGSGAGDGNGHFDPTNNADTIRIDTAILADRLHYIGPFSTFSIDEVTGVEIRGSGTFQPLRLTHTGTGHTQMTFSSTDQSWDLGFNQTGTDGFLINDNTANTVPVFIEEGVLDDALRIESTGQLKFAAYDGTPPTGTEFGILAHESDGDIISVDPGSLGGPGGDNIYTVSDSIDNEDRLVFVRNANTLEIELDTLTGDFGAEFQITTQGADTILRAGTFDSGTEYIEIGSGVYPTFSDILYGEMSVLTVNGLTVQQPTNSNTGLGTLYNNANGSTLFIGMVDPAKDSLFLINEDWADESPLDAYLSFDNDLNETKAYRPLIVNQASDAVEGIKIESTKTTDEAATLNLRGRQDGTDNLSSAIYFSNFDDDGGATSPTANLANIKLDRSVGDDEDGILTVNTYKVNGTETTHITADAISESTEINGFRMNQTTTAATSLTASATEQVIYATTSSGFTLTLPDADAMLGMPIKLYAPNASSVTITGGSGDTVTDYSSNFNRPLEMVAFGANLWTVQN